VYTESDIDMTLPKQRHLDAKLLQKMAEL